MVGAGRRIIVHDLSHAEAAVAAAAEAGVGVTLVSAPGAAAYLGAAVFRQIVEAARAVAPGVEVRAVLDCGADPGLALNALRLGVDAVRVEAKPKVRARLADMARKQGARLDEAAGAALDLCDVADPRAACGAWLAGRARRAPGGRRANR